MDSLKYEVNEAVEHVTASYLSRMNSRGKDNDALVVEPSRSRSVWSGLGEETMNDLFVAVSHTLLASEGDHLHSSPFN